MSLSRRAIVSRLAITFAALWALSSLLWLESPMLIALAPVAPVHQGLSLLFSGDLDMAIVSLGISALTLSLAAFSIAKRRAAGAAMAAVVFYWLWIHALLGIGA